MKSTDDTYALHETLFESSNPRDPSQWSEWFKEHAFSGTGDSDDAVLDREGIYYGSVLPGINRKSQKQWDIEKVLGFTQHDIRKSRNTAVARGRHKTKS
jgi:hypothetical protein